MVTSLCSLSLAEPKKIYQDAREPGKQSPTGRPPAELKLPGHRVVLALQREGICN